MISARKLSVHKGGKQLLRDVNLDIVPGLFTAIAGPNGAGKTSLLKAISCESSFTGSLEINGIALNKYSVAELSKVRAVLPQTSHLQFPFTVEQVVRLGHKLNGGFHSKTSETIEEVMQLTDVADWRSRNFLTLSGGEQQRVHLARVLAQVWEAKDTARYVLLDEPTSALDLAAATFSSSAWLNMRPTQHRDPGHCARSESGRSVC